MGLALQVSTQCSSLPPLTETDGKPAQAANANNVIVATTISARRRRLQGEIDNIGHLLVTPHERLFRVYIWRHRGSPSINFSPHRNFTASSVLLIATEANSVKAAIKRISILAIGLTLLVLVLAAGFSAGLRYHFHPSAPQPSPPAADALEAQRQDLRYFRQLIALDRSFEPTGRTEAIRRLDALETLGTVLDRPHFQVALMQIDALADNGHSGIENDGSAASLELPVRLVAFSDGLYIMRATEINADLLGGRVTMVDGQSIDAVMTKLEQLRGGTPQWRRLLASQYLRQQDLLYGIDVAPDTRYSVWTVETPAGEVITRRLEAYAPAVSEPGAPFTRWLSSESLAGLEGQWRAVEPAHPLPIALTNFDMAFRSVALPGTCVQFVQFKSNSDQGGQRIREFVSDTEGQLQQIRPCSVILDLRYDRGGDYLNTYGFAHNLPKLIPPGGRIVVLTGPATFSAGISTAAAVKHAGQGRVLIVGEPVGDRLQFYSEGGSACLPHSLLCVAYETGKHDYQHACTDWDVCFWLNYFFSFQVQSLDPDEVIPLSFKDWQSGVDPVLDRAITLDFPTFRGHPSALNRRLRRLPD
jgi:hypothetical protein